MSSRLKAIVAGVAEQLGDETVEMVLDQVEVSRRSAPARVVWVPLGGTIEPTDHVGGRLTAGTPPERRRAVYVDAQRVQVRLWATGEDRDKARDAVETLFHRVVAATRRALLADARWGAWEWVTQLPERAGATVLGQLIVAELTVRVPVFDQVRQLSTVTTTSTHETIEIKGGSEVTDC